MYIVNLAISVHHDKMWGVVHYLSEIPRNTAVVMSKVM